MGHLPAILLETRELCLPCSVVFPLQAKVEPPKMPAAIPPISHGTHIPGPSPHHSSVSAAPNTYSSTCIRSKDDPTRGSQDFKNSSRSPRRPALLLRRHLLQARGWKIPVPLARQPRGANNSRHNISFRVRTTKPLGQRAI